MVAAFLSERVHPVDVEKKQQMRRSSVREGGFALVFPIQFSH